MISKLKQILSLSSFVKKEESLFCYYSSRFCCCRCCNRECCSFRLTSLSISVACTLPDLKQSRSRSVSLSLDAIMTRCKTQHLPSSQERYCLTVWLCCESRWSTSWRICSLLNSQLLLSFSFKSFWHCF